MTKRARGGYFRNPNWRTAREIIFELAFAFGVLLPVAIFLIKIVFFRHP